MTLEEKWRNEAHKRWLEIFPHTLAGRYEFMEGWIQACRKRQKEIDELISRVKQLEEGIRKHRDKPYGWMADDLYKLLEK